MRVLLDECVPRALGKELVGHDVRTVTEAGWAGVKNGELLRLAAGQFGSPYGGLRLRLNPPYAYVLRGNEIQGLPGNEIRKIEPG